jgi:hypothetical protein
MASNGIGSSFHWTFLRVYPKFITTFPMLPKPIPYSEHESLLLWQRFFFLASCFLIAFSSLSILECHLLAQLREGVLCGIGFLSTFLGSMEIGYFCSVFLVPTTIIGVVHGMRTPMLLAEVAMLLDASFLGNLARILGTRPLVSFLALVRMLLVGLCIGSFLGTYALNSLERHEKQTFVHGSHSFLVKVELILPQVWAHLKNMTR